MSSWIAAITRGHNGGVCLLKDGEIVFSIEEERLSRKKYDGGPLASMVKILDYTDKLDYLIVAHTQPLEETSGKIDFTGDDMYTGLARKLGLIDQHYNGQERHPQVVDLSHMHHKLHAACAFYRSGFESAAALIVDGAGTFINTDLGNGSTYIFELETIFSCNYPQNFKTLFKHLGGNGPFKNYYTKEMGSEKFDEEGFHECIIDDTAGIVKAYEAVTTYCGFQSIEAGKTMGLFPYGKPNDNIPPIYTDAGGDWRTADRSLVIPTYPNGAQINHFKYNELTQPENYQGSAEVVATLPDLQNRRDLAYAVQTQSQQEVLKLIYKAVEMSGEKNVVISGGYGLNCVANYYYLEQLKEDGINIYVEPVSSDAGTAIGAALYAYYNITHETAVRPFGESLYLGLPTEYTADEVTTLAEQYNAEVHSITPTDIVEIIRNKNIVAMFQGRSESGPRALGNRSLMFDPTFEDGKDFVNNIKRREYFRPFAGSILHEHAHDWFEMRGLEETPHMMYAMNCQPGIAEKIPSIIHEDGTCRIQTVKEHQNPFYYEIINEFYNQTGVPIIFNTSFNLGGEPLVETLDDAFRTLASSEIEYLYLPEHRIIAKVPNVS
jgi:carbamoyltransferase|tara:strand:- start:2009 stop:3826 length:1818 start_codon:yes stop_codon:yes gene_type:complete